MTQDRNDVFNFELNELLWFQKGQEVRELIGIALEPDISIYESEEFVSVRGVIELTGEYMPSERDPGEEYDDHIVTFQERNSKTYIQDVRSFDDGLNEFHYNIPVEITIPKYRVPSLDDVTVEIDYFDYEIPEPSQLKLQAEVAIAGIQQETNEPNPARGEEVAPEAVSNWEETTQPFSFDLTFDDEESSSHIEESSVSETYPVNEEDYQDQHSEKEREPWFKKKSQTFEEFFGNKDQEEAVEEKWNEESPYVDSSYEDSPYEESPYGEQPYEESPSENIRPTIEYHTEAKKVEEDEETREDAVYLVNMFDREEDTYARIRMCIVQESDTLESIAERYQLPITHIVRYNNLEDEEISAGEILYIPRKNKVK